MTIDGQVLEYLAVTENIETEVDCWKIAFTMERAARRRRNGV
jgi:hypothetical protein